MKHDKPLIILSPWTGNNSFNSSYKLSHCTDDKLNCTVDDLHPSVNSNLTYSSSLETFNDNEVSMATLNCCSVANKQAELEAFY